MPLSSSSSVILSSFLALGVPHFAKEREREMRERAKEERSSFFFGCDYDVSFVPFFFFLLLFVVLLSCELKARKATRGGGGEDGRRRELYTQLKLVFIRSVLKYIY